MISAQRIKQPTTTLIQARFYKELIPIPCHQFFRARTKRRIGIPKRTSDNQSWL